MSTKILIVIPMQLKFDMPACMVLGNFEYFLGQRGDYSSTSQNSFHASVSTPVLFQYFPVLTQYFPPRVNSTSSNSCSSPEMMRRA